MPKIDLNPDNYKSTFWGRFADSFYEEREGNECWRQVIVRQNRDDEANTFVDALGNGECRFITDGSCPHKALFHYHQNLWANPRKGSPLHLFLISLKEHGRLVLSDPAEIKGRNFNLEEYKTDEWTNKSGEVVKSRIYYLISGSDLDIPEEDKHPSAAIAPLGDSLPFDSGAAPTNGTNGTATITEDETILLEVLAKYSDGKTEPEIKQGIIVRNQIPEMPANFRPKIMNGSALKMLVENGIIEKDESGKYKYALAIE